MSAGHNIICVQRTQNSFLKEPPKDDFEESARKVIDRAYFIILNKIDEIDGTNEILLKWIDKPFLLCYTKTNNTKGVRNMPKSIMTKQKFINQWLKHFAKDLSKDDVNRYVKDQYIWHVFSWNLLNTDAFLSGDEARRAYDEVDKSACIYCDMFGSNGISDHMLNEYGSSEDIDKSVTELYVVSKDYSWTYIKTHENNLCGPYFIKIK